MLPLVQPLGLSPESTGYRASGSQYNCAAALGGYREYIVAVRMHWWKHCWLLGTPSAVDIAVMMSQSAPCVPPRSGIELRPTEFETSRREGHHMSSFELLNQMAMLAGYQAYQLRRFHIY